MGGAIRTWGPGGGGGPLTAKGLGGPEVMLWGPGGGYWLGGPLL